MSSRVAPSGPRRGLLSLCLPIAVGVASAAAPLAAQTCTAEWTPEFGALPGLDLGAIEAMAVFDDGLGAVLVVAGEFETIGGVAARNIAAWDGVRWSALAGGLDAPVDALAAFDDGSGLALFAGGAFTEADGQPVGRIARWDGQAWSDLSGGVSHPTGPARVQALEVFDPGTGAVLVATGNFELAGSVAAEDFAAWDGAAWSPLGSGGTDGAVYALEAYDDGTGERLYAGGLFQQVGGVAAKRLASWDGVSWSEVGGGVSSTVSSLGTFDDGSGARLVAGGFFTLAGTVPAAGIAAWDGQQWSALGAGVIGVPDALLSMPTSGGAALIVGGNLVSAGGAPVGSIARWDGQSWSELQGGGVDDDVDELALFDDGAGLALFAAGQYQQAGGLAAPGLARWSGASWSSLGQQTLNGSVHAFGVHDDGSGPALFAGGQFDAYGTTVLNGIARWTGVEWEALGDGILGFGNPVAAIESFDDGSGPALFVAGEFQESFGAPADAIARWDGQQWSALATSITTPRIFDLEVFDGGAGPELIALGEFGQIDGAPFLKVARWDGAQWGTLGTGIVSGFGNALVVHDDGAGEDLYVGGEFLIAGGQPAASVLRWDGAQWSALGDDPPFAVETLLSYDAVGGPRLVAGGRNTSPDGDPLDFLAWWDGVQWQPFGGGLDGRVRALAQLPGTAGMDLIATGSFEASGAQPLANVARWDGATWSPMGSGLPPFGANALIAFDDGAGPALFAGGNLESAPDSHDAFAARWGCPTHESMRETAVGSPVALGGTCKLRFRAPDHAGALYVAALSTGVSTGIPITTGNPPVAQVLPLDLDGLLLSSLSGSGAFPGFSGVLDAAGEGVGAITLPAIPQLSGLTVYGAFVTLKPLPSPIGISGATAIQIQ